ncbi:MAG TPA: hypothetical protein PKD96_02930, partial [Candidatus Absconditabacterales bacterium]|nr:hypothetical protein [Candidatus Absconditabacterales bacterium]
MKAQLKNHRETLHRIEQEISMARKGKSASDTETFGQYDVTLVEIQNNIDRIKSDLAKVTTHEEIVENSYEHTFHNVKDVKKFKKNTEQINRYLRRLDKELLKAERSELQREELQNIRMYLEATINNQIDPNVVSYSPKNTTAYGEIKALSAFVKEFDKNYVKKLNSGKESNGVNPDVLAYNQQVNSTYESYLKNTDTEKVFKEKGLVGLLEKYVGQTGNMTPGQRKFWKGAATIGVTAGLLYGGFQLLKSFFSEKDGSWLKGGGKNLALTAAAVMGSQYVLGVDPVTAIWKTTHGGRQGYKLPHWMGEMVGPESKIAQTEQTRKFVAGPTAVQWTLGGIPYNDISFYKLIYQAPDGKVKVDQEKMAEYLTGKNRLDQLEAVKKLADDPNNLIDTGLNQVGVSFHDIIDPANAQNTVNQKTEIYQNRFYSVEARFKKNKLKFKSHLIEEKFYKTMADQNITKPEDINTQLDELISNGDIVPEDLSEDSAIADTMGLTEDLKGAKLDPKERNELIVSGNRLATVINQPIEYEIQQDHLFLKSYGEITEINLTKKNLSHPTIGEWSVAFGSVDEMVKAANFVNFLRNKFAGKGNEANAFKVGAAGLLPEASLTQGLGRDIYFDGTDTFDTKVIGGGRWSSLQQLSPTIENNKNDFFGKWINSMGIWKKPGEENAEK